jgi:hypothetical protein
MLVNGAAGQFAAEIAKGLGRRRSRYGPAETERKAHGLGREPIQVD